MSEEPAGTSYTFEIPSGCDECILHMNVEEHRSDSDQPDSVMAGVKNVKM